MIFYLILFFLFTPEPYFSRGIGEFELRISGNPHHFTDARIDLAQAQEIILSEEIPQPVSISLISENEGFVANYQTLFRLNFLTGEVSTIPPPVAFWQPTGVFVSGHDLFVANYQGGEVFRLSHEGKLLQTIVHPTMKGPENVSIAGNIIFVADYDGHALHAFNLQGDLLWAKYIPYCHGVTSDSDFVYATGLRERSLHKFTHEGKEVAKRSHLGWGENLFPVQVTCSENYIAVTDSHTGMITLHEKKNLQPIRKFGGNGPGSDLFHMPYAIVSHGNKFYVGDTFKKRFFLMDTFGKVEKILALSFHPNLKDLPRLGEGYIRYVNPEGTLSLFGDTWYTGFAGFNLQGLPSKEIFPPKFLQVRTHDGLLFSHSTYFTYAGPISKYQIFGASEWGFLLINSEGQFCPFRGNYYWIDGALVDFWGEKVDLAPFIEEAEAKWTAYQDPAQLHSLFFPEMSEEEFEKKLQNTLGEKESFLFPSLAKSLVLNMLSQK